MLRLGSPPGPSPNRCNSQTPPTLMQHLEAVPRLRLENLQPNHEMTMAPLGSLRPTPSDPRQPVAHSGTHQHHRGHSGTRQRHRGHSGTRQRPPVHSLRSPLERLGPQPLQGHSMTMVHSEAAARAVAGLEPLGIRQLPQEPLGQRPRLRPPEGPSIRTTKTRLEPLLPGALLLASPALEEGRVTHLGLRALVPLGRPLQAGPLGGLLVAAGPLERPQPHLEHSELPQAVPLGQPLLVERLVLMIPLEGKLLVGVVLPAAPSRGVEVMILLGAEETLSAQLEGDIRHPPSPQHPAEGHSANQWRPPPPPQSSPRLTVHSLIFRSGG